MDNFRYYTSCRVSVSTMASKKVLWLKLIQNDVCLDFTQILAVNKELLNAIHIRVYYKHSGLLLNMHSFTATYFDIMELSGTWIFRVPEDVIAQNTTFTEEFNGYSEIPARRENIAPKNKTSYILYKYIYIVVCISKYYENKYSYDFSYVLDEPLHFAIRK